jgi:hypothetical protein
MTLGDLGHTYVTLTAKLLLAASEVEQDLVIAELDRVWLTMTDDERGQVEAHLNRYLPPPAQGVR